MFIFTTLVSVSFSKHSQQILQWSRTRKMGELLLAIQCDMNITIVREQLPELKENKYFSKPNYSVN